jgi:undecaprenyl-diphosphatase
MTILESIIYGIIQGLTEFLPVSSSGHLALLPLVLDIEDPGVVFDLSMHLGTALAIICYFWSKLLGISKGAISFVKNKDEASKDQFYFFRNICIGTAATVVCVLLFKDLAEEYGRSSKFIAFNLIFFGILMYVADRFFPSTMKDKFYQGNGLLVSILVGVAQGFAVFPGVSRSGITLTTSRFFGVDKQNASEFVFILSLPIIFMGIIYKLPVLLSGEHSFSLIICVLGIIISFIMGLLTIHFFLVLIRKIGLGIFTIYRIILGILILVLLN